MKSYHTDHNSIYWEDEHKTFINKWKPSTAVMTEEEYKGEIETIVNYINRLQPLNLLADLSEQLFPVTPQLINWQLNNFMKKVFSNGIIKLAIVLPHDFISKISTELFIREIEENFEELKHFLKYFKNSSEAKKWLKKAN